MFWNTAFGYFVFLITIVGFIFCFLISNNFYDFTILNPVPEGGFNPGFSQEQYKEYLETYYIFNTFSFFTQLTNIACFIFMTFFVAFNRKIAFRNNTIMIAVSAYIFIVSAIFWFYLFPTSLDNYVLDFQWAKTSWSHAVVPLSLIAFTVTSLLLNKNAPQKFKK